ncbi:MAG: methylamine utilization protein MauG [Gammaproteobacteria bacterium]|nr:methylamine utilization protein MauG [Gammaproteobacteria bacterium]
MDTRIALVIVLLVTGFAAAQAAAVDDRATLGRLLYFDVNLSKQRTQSCASCHVPEAGFVDARENGVGRAASVGDDGVSLGDRNTPTASYASLTPRFAIDAAGRPIGGLFLDGRAADLAEQAGGPPLNPLEMGMPDKAAVVQRLQQNPVYVEAFAQLFGEDVWRDVDGVYHAMTQAIAAYEQTDEFSPFDSKYDRYLRGEYQLTAQEDLGMTLFFSQQFTNCNVCHQLRPRAGMPRETFSNYEYHNIGTPVNAALRARNGKDAAFVDRGLLDNPGVDEPKHAGKFKVPTLRNVAVTAPYMHNGVFRDLRTVILFYNKYNSRSAKRQINPETGENWRAPEVAENLSLKELRTGPALDDRRVDALVAFLKTLTDRRYESLLDD